MRLLIIRHAESEHNIAKTAHLDSCLTDTGLRQTRKLATGLVNEFPDISSWIGYTSPFLRAIQTSLDLMEAGVSFKVDWRLRESMIPAFGYTQEDVVRVPMRLQQYPAYFQDLDCDPEWRNKCESYDELKQRCTSFIQDLNNSAGNYIIISHGLTVAALVDAAMGLNKSPEWDGSIHNACVTFIRDGECKYKFRCFS